MYPKVKEERFHPVAFKLLSEIRRKLIPVKGVFQNSKIVDNLIEQIKSIGDDLGTPIFRVGQKFIIYKGDEQFEIRKSAFEEYLCWCASDMGVDGITVYEERFIHMLFGAAYRVLAPEE